MIDDDVCELISEYIDNRYVITCESMIETKDVISKLKKLEYPLYETCYGDFDDEYLGVGFVGARIDRWINEQTSRPSVRYADIIVQANLNQDENKDMYEDNDFEARFADLLS